MSNARTLARLMPNASGQLPDAALQDNSVSMRALQNGTLNGYVASGTARTSSDFSVGSGWTDFLSIGSFTLTQTGVVHVESFMSNGYEAGSGWYSHRLQLRGSNTLTSDEQFSAQGYSDNQMHGNFFSWSFDNVPAGTYTVYAQATLLTGAVTLNARNGFDNLHFVAYHKK